MPDLDNLFQDEKILQMVVFSLGKEEYCVPIMNVQEIIMPQEMTKIPRSPEFIEGVINLRGNIVPIIDGCKRFQIDNIDSKKQKSDERIVVLDINQHIAGLVVDNVSEVINITREQVDLNPTSENQEEDFILGIAKLGKRLLIMLNPENFLNLGEMQSLVNISQAVQQMKKATEIVKDPTTEENDTKQDVSKEIKAKAVTAKVKS